MDTQKQVDGLLKIVGARILPDIQVAIDAIKIGDPQAAIRTLEGLIQDVNEQGQQLFEGQPSDGANQPLAPSTEATSGEPAAPASGEEAPKTEQQDSSQPGTVQDPLTNDAQPE